MWADRIEGSNMIWCKRWYDIIWYLKLQLQIAKNVLSDFCFRVCYNVSLYQVVARPDWDLTESLKRSKLEAPHSSQTQDHSNNKTRSQATRTSSDFPRRRWTSRKRTQKKTLRRNLLHPKVHFWARAANGHECCRKSSCIDPGFVLPCSWPLLLLWKVQVSNITFVGFPFLFKKETLDVSKNTAT